MYSHRLALQSHSTSSGSVTWDLRCWSHSGLVSNKPRFSSRSTTSWMIYGRASSPRSAGNARSITRVQRLDPESTSWLFLGIGRFHPFVHGILIFFWCILSQDVFSLLETVLQLSTPKSSNTFLSKQSEPISYIAPLRITWGGNDLAWCYCTNERHQSQDYHLGPGPCSRSRGQGSGELRNKKARKIWIYLPVALIYALVVC